MNVKTQLQKEAEKYWNAVNEIAGEQFHKVVKPWLVKHGYVLVVGMGAWVVYYNEHKLAPIHSREIPSRVLEVLEVTIPLYDHELGSCMPEWPEE